MLDLSEIGVSYYEIGGEIQTCQVSETTAISHVEDVPVVALDADSVRDNPSSVCYAPQGQPSGWVPYSYGNPLINLAANILSNSIGRVVTPYYDPTDPQMEGPI